MHSTAAEAATIARKAQVKQLIIGHFSARVLDQSLFREEAKPIFENTLLAEERKTYTLSNLNNLSTLNSPITPNN